MSSFMFEGIYLRLWSFWRWLFGGEVKTEVEFITINKPIKRIKMVNPRDSCPARKRRRTTLLEWNGLDIENVNWKAQHYA